MHIARPIIIQPDALPRHPGITSEVQDASTREMSNREKRDGCQRFLAKARASTNEQASIWCVPFSRFHRKIMFLRKVHSCHSDSSSRRSLPIIPMLFLRTERRTWDHELRQ
mmetsp:Transcript_40715/g.93469  ORF Transcript_40715/g.93469 Transcript_40715/m.93469 type:complete len:111 (-) Transcript_40715:971-1303(-)